MRFSLCASVALISTLVYGVPHEALHAEGTGLSSLEPRQALNKKPGCLRKGVHIIAGSGAGGAHIRGYGLLSTTVDAIRAAVPGSSNYSVPFTKTNDPSKADAADREGVQLMTANIEWYAKGCPKTPIVLLGYSQGGIIVMDTVCGRSRYDGQSYGTPLNSSYTANIIATLTYGEETRTPNHSWDTGTCISGRGVTPRANPGGCAAFAPYMKAWCDYNDPYCCAGSPNPDSSIHYTYPKKYDSTVAQYVAQRYAEFKGKA